MTNAVPISRLVVGSLVFAFILLIASSPMSARTFLIAQTPAAPSQKQAATPSRTIRVASGVGLQRAPVDIAIARGYFAKENLAIDLVVMGGVQEQLPHLATGELDVALGGIGSGLFNAVARGISVKMVASCSNADAGHPTLTFLVRKDLLDGLQITKVTDFKGRKIALSSVGSNAGTNTEALLKAAGLKLSDVDITPLGYAEMNVALANKSVDAAWSLEPFVTSAVERNIAVAWKTDHELFPNKQGCVVMYSPRFAQDRDMAVSFIRAYLKGARDYTDAFYKNKDWDEVVQILTRSLPIKDPAMYRKLRVPAQNPNGEINRKSLETDLDFFVRAGIVKATVDLSQVIDGTFSVAAVKELGRYE